MMDVDSQSKVSLNLTNLSLDSIPDYVYDTIGLEELYLEEGNSIHVADRYILIDRISTLKHVDGRNISSIRDGITRLTEIFNRRLEEMFLTKAAREIFNKESPEEIRQSEMKQLAKKTIMSGPDVLAKFRDYKLEQMISDRYDVLVSQALEVIIENQEKKEIMTLTPSSKKTRTQNNKRVKQNKTKLNMSSNDNKAELTKNLALKQLLITHSKDNNPKDDTTKVWMCEFEPDVNDCTKTTHIVATCGGDSICLIDCKRGEVIKKYKQPGEKFYCISWTVMKVPSSTDDSENSKKDDYFTMLAAAGVLGDIKLIDPKKLVCFQQVSHHKKPIDALIFHTINPNWLFSGSEDQTIVLWEVFVPYIGQMKQARRNLTLESGTSGVVRQIAITPHGKIVFAACDDGLYAYDISELNFDDMHSPKYRVNFPTEKQLPLDSANCLSDHLTAVKRVNEGAIHLLCSQSQFMQNDVQIIHTLSWRITETPFLKFNFIKGCNVLLAGDDKSVIWAYNLNQIIEKAKDFQNHSKLEKFSVACEKLRCESPATKLFNHVTASSSFQEVVGVTDNNIVAIWRVP